MAYSLGRLALGLMHRTGVLDAAISLNSSPRWLMYHRFGAPARRRAIGIETFERQLVRLRSRHHVFTCTTLARHWISGHVPADSVALTIDDGYREVYTEVFPLLKRLALPATIYVVTDFVDGRLWLWPDRVAHVMLTTRQRDWVFAVNGRRIPYTLASEASRLKAWSDCADYLLTLRPPERDQQIDLLARDLGVVLPDEPPVGYEPVTWAQLREMSDAGFEVASHGCTHPRMSLLDEAGIREEATRSRHRIEEMVGRPVTSFSYPHGTQDDVNDQVREGVVNAGYENAVMSVDSNRPMSDPLLLPRTAIGSDFRGFLATLAGIRFGR